MTITAQDKAGNVRELKGDRVEFFEDFVGVWNGEKSIGRFAIEDVLRIRQECKCASRTREEVARELTEVEALEGESIKARALQGELERM